MLPNCVNCWFLFSALWALVNADLKNTALLPHVCLCLSQTWHLLSSIQTIYFLVTDPWFWRASWVWWTHGSGGPHDPWWAFWGPVCLDGLMVLWAPCESAQLTFFTSNCCHPKMQHISLLYEFGKVIYNFRWFVRTDDIWRWQNSKHLRVQPGGNIAKHKCFGLCMTNVTIWILTITNKCILSQLSADRSPFTQLPHNPYNLCKHLTLYILS